MFKLVTVCSAKLIWAFKTEPEYMDDLLLSPHDLGTDTPRREQPVGNAGKTHVLISKSTF